MALLMEFNYIYVYMCIHTHTHMHTYTYMGFPGGSAVKDLPVNAGDMVQSLGWEDQSPGEGNGNPFQYSCLGNPLDRDWWATIHGITKSQTELGD